MEIASAGVPCCPSLPLQPAAASWSLLSSHTTFLVSTAPRSPSLPLVPTLQRAAGMLDLARKLEPGLGERFMLFVRDREQKQRQGAGGSDGSYDLLSYVRHFASGRRWLPGALAASSKRSSGPCSLPPHPSSTLSSLPPAPQVEFQVWCCCCSCSCTSCACVVPLLCSLSVWWSAG